jgi:acetoin utilization deacetylase AcuC-like enzyme
VYIRRKSLFFLSRVRWGVVRVAIVDIDVHFGNGTAEIFRHDPNTFFASVHMIHGMENNGSISGQEVDAGPSHGFFPAKLGSTSITDTYVSVGIYPEPNRRSKKIKRVGTTSSEQEDHVAETDIRNFRGPAGYRTALESIVLPHVEAFRPELLIISGTFGFAL